VISIATVLITLLAIPRSAMIVQTLSAAVPAIVLLADLLLRKTAQEPALRVPKVTGCAAEGSEEASEA
jgi:hypothetical protein